MIEKYVIPNDIDTQIPDYFYYALFGELMSVFGEDLLKSAKEFGCLPSSTAGWVAAFTMTCKKLDMKNVLEYYNSLDWYDSDQFDGIIENRVIDKVIIKGNFQANSYYQYLLDLLDKC